MHDLVTLRFFYNLGHEYFRFIHSNFGMQGVFGLSQSDTSQMHMSDSGIQTNDSDLRNLSHDLQQTLKIDNSNNNNESINKNISNASPNNNVSYNSNSNNNKRYNRHYYSGKKDHKNMNYRGHGGGGGVRYQHKGGNNSNISGGNVKKDQTSHVSSPSSSSHQPQSHHNQAQQSSSQQQQQKQHQHLHNDSGNAQCEYNSPNVSERFDLPPPIDIYQVYNVL